jgi:hypothetical protein
MEGLVCYVIEWGTCTLADYAKVTFRSNLGVVEASLPIDEIGDKGPDVSLLCTTYYACKANSSEARRPDPITTGRRKA